MKKFLIVCLAFIAGLNFARADEGMWLLKLMKQQHLADSLKRAGLKIKPEELYNENGPSLRDCIGIFGNGCTGEVVSADGLVMTNHHCGFSYVHDLSTEENDIMKNGYFSKSRAEELQSGASFTFVLGIDDVTEEVNRRADAAGLDAYDRQTAGYLGQLADSLLKVSRYKDQKGMRARLLPYFGASNYYIFYEQTYSDVRLVVNPPYNVGQFGGNSDNWMWPRQNADFAVFRIYAGADGQPAPYSKENKPLHCRKFLPISLKGYKEGDYTMIMGFPGSTSRYLTASSVATRTNTNAAVVTVGQPLLDYYKRQMDMSDKNRLALEDAYFSLGNAVKNYAGMNESVEKTGLMEIKKAEEGRFREYIRRAGKKEYEGLIEEIARQDESRADTLFDVYLYSVGIGNSQLDIPVPMVNGYVSAVRSQDTAAIRQSAAALAAACQELFGEGNKIYPFAREAASLLVPIFIKSHKLAGMPAYMKDSKACMALVDSAFTHSVYTDSERLQAALQAGDTAVLLNDPRYRVALDNMNYVATTFSNMNAGNRESVVWRNKYVRGLCEMYEHTKAPDANFTLRMTYGHVSDLVPRDAVRYDWKTTLDGMFEKESKSESDYFINEDLRQLYKKGDYGRYARKDGKMQTCFLSNNDITGGNSGSGVLNAKGELIGLAFDGNIESLSSDLRFNRKLQRCINVDIRYVLYLIDVYGGSKYVIDELDLR